MASKLSSSSCFACTLLLLNFVLPICSHSQYSHLHPIHHHTHSNGTNASPSEFLRNMQGFQKGEKVQSIRQLKLYLTQLGYLNHQNLTNLEQEEDHFGEEVVSAIKSYQLFHHLNATGALDTPTVSNMAMPRCGFPDITISRYQFFPFRPKWPEGKRHLTYAFGYRFPTRFIPPVARAFTRWAIASRYFTFSRAASYRTADITIGFARRAHGDGYPFDGNGGVLAHAFGPTDGRLHFDADDRWVVGPVPEGHDVETLALHEIGHLLGLGHSRHQNAIMWPTFSPGETKGLSSDDLRGLRDLYRS